jgi:hypothetical protein
VCVVAGMKIIHLHDGLLIITTLVGKMPAGVTG